MALFVFLLMIMMTAHSYGMMTTITGSSSSANRNTNSTSSSIRTHKASTNNHAVLKRSFGPFAFDSYHQHEDHIPGFANNKLHSFAPMWAQPNIFTLTPIDVATAIAAAKQASASVLIAQQQVQAAKENVLLQQRIAAEKESQAEILRQKSESAAAIQRSEAAAAAQGVVLAQQRLAHAKNSVAQQQHIASAKEAKAAAALQRVAQEAAVEIHKAEYEATRLANIQQTESAAAAHHLSAVKNSAVSPLTSSHNGHPHTNIALPSFQSPGHHHHGIPSAWNNIPAISAPLYGLPTLNSVAPFYVPKPAAAPPTSFAHLPSPWIY